MHGLTSVSYADGDSAEIVDKLRPGLAFFATALPRGTGPNRAPGDIKASWKWNKDLATHLNPSRRVEYRQALSQVNWYMKQHNARHGFLLTDRELVAFRRRDDNSNLELARPIAFTTGRTDERPQMTLTELVVSWDAGCSGSGGRSLVYVISLEDGLAYTAWELEGKQFMDVQ